MLCIDFNSDSWIDRGITLAYASAGFIILCLVGVLNISVIVTLLPQHCFTGNEKKQQKTLSKKRKQMIALLLVCCCCSLCSLLYTFAGKNNHGFFSKFYAWKIDIKYAFIYLFVETVVLIVSVQCGKGAEGGHDLWITLKKLSDNFHIMRFYVMFYVHHLFQINMFARPLRNKEFKDIGC